MDYRHPQQQIANKYMAAFRDTITDPDADIDLQQLERYVNSAIAEMNKQNLPVYADGSSMRIAGVGISYVGNQNRINIEFIPYD